MSKDLSNYRKKYSKGKLVENIIPKNPIDLFSNWFNDVEQNKSEQEPNIMSISTVDENKMPRSRIVLLKKFSKSGFVFFTNYNSRKGLNINLNSNVCLSFYWPNFERQVIVNGKATKISETDSVEYFDRRPKGSKIGAIISNQSNVIESRDLLDKKFSELLKSGIPLNKPNYWGGYLVKPTEIEFWQGRENRLHDRIIYKNDDKNWKFYRLSP
ncbi:MAG: pyridoxamine 5'-phosphate oxidase [Flavobacteriaceae bacterium]|jgi:pyridoxamine 5'-phosphate oxidase|nr:pyridoxamine 5'-phosphate oxidase [Flavobacteriaceae bacterium]MBT4062569.1 pyridoxamine 5'-phosphate oxidase [Flavobacteriaceae bacterium]MBT4245763.1 pyridoxamine 5'-phosphate oxidase [Flavobacteriaceae bacterium]MBT4415017.1 pyridoxamine 5'-phosphate oxidase [Flavobacteriaceae bacterium]MBT5395617.1 pyridoxamine 5'-phosphate oxidase [Flavobacteriaceae bacterium]